MRVIAANHESSHPSSAPGDPTVQVLLDHLPTGQQLSITQVSIPADSRLREHDHGDAEVVLIPVFGELIARSGSQRERLVPGRVALIPRGERVEYANETPAPATMIMVATDIEPARDERAVASPSNATDTDQAHWVPAGLADQVADGTAVHVDLQGHALCIARSQGHLHALRDECSHGQVQLSEGEVDDGFVECWMHGSRFDLRTGIPACLPATQPVAVYPVRITDGTIEVALPQ